MERGRVNGIWTLGNLGEAGESAEGSPCSAVREV